MLRALWFLLVLTAAGAATVRAQTQAPAEAGDPSLEKPRGLLREPYLTSTGQTVPRPGVSQSAPTSELDRRIQEQNDRIEQTICSNCK